MRRIFLLLAAIFLFHLSPAMAFEDTEDFAPYPPQHDDQGDYREIRFQDSYGGWKPWSFWIVHARTLNCRVRPYGDIFVTYPHGEVLYTAGRLVLAGQYKRPWISVRQAFGSRNEFCWVRAHNDFIRPYLR